MKDKLLLLFLLIGLSATTIHTYAQNYSGHNWYLGGSNRGIRFSRSDNSATLATLPSPLGTSADAPSAVVTDPVNGNLLFYTDGTTIYDATYRVMPGGNGLNANPAGKQSVAVAKVPGQPDQFYVITNSSTGDVTFRIVDMTRFGNALGSPIPLGEGVSNTNSPIAGLTGRSEAMIVIPHENSTDSWLITQNAGSPTYTITLIDAAGIGVTSVTQPGNLGSITSAGSFSYHEPTGGLAVTPNEPGRNIEILNFDNATGTLTFNQPIPNSSSVAGVAAYDTEWSNSGDYLYISRQNNVLQFDVQNPSNSLASVLPQPNTIAQSYGLQMGPDSSIYHLYQATAGGPYLLGKITDSDTVATEVNYVAQAFAGNVNFNAKQFPSFAKASDNDFTVSFTANGLCSNAPTSFYPTVNPTADSLKWEFEPGAISREWSPVYTYQAGGSFNVTLTGYLNGDSVKSTQPITINQFDTQINLVQDTTACSCELPFPQADPPPAPCGQFSVTAQVQGGGTLQWFGPGGAIPGATSATLQPDSAGFYYVVATVGNCQAYAGVNIKEYGIEDQRANIWYFGDRAGLDFNPMFDTPPANGPTPISNPVMNAPEGTSTISDRNGQVIFFTDGETVWDREFTVIGTNIGGSVNAAQSSLIMPVPGDETLYYIFTTQEVYGTGTFQLRYTLFDLKLNNGKGGIVDPDNNPATPELSTVLFEPSTERITGTADWIIAHEYGNNTFRAYQITPQGISNPVISSIGSDHSFSVAANGQGYMKLSSQNTLAVALPTPGVSNVVELFDFSNTTGEITNFRRADLQDPNGLVYGIEFSPSGQKLYASTIGTSKLFELAYDSATGTYIRVPEIQPITTPNEIGAIQIGPGGSIYVANNNQNFLGTIQPVDIRTSASIFTPNAQPIAAGTTSRLGLPNFNQIIANPIQEPSIAVAGLCLGDSTSFEATGTDIIDEFQWFFGDGQSATGQSASHVYAAAGNYTVTLIITNRCGLNRTLTENITITAPPAPPTFLPPGQFPVLCNGPLTLAATGSTDPTLSFLWSTGETTRTIQVAEQNIYSVTITNAQGCTSDGEITIADNRPIVELGPDQTICQNTTVATLDAQNPGMTYAWFLNDVANGNASRTQAVNTGTIPPLVKEYKVRVSDPVTSCVVTDSVIFTINPSPTFTFNTTAPTTCQTPTGAIDVNITGPANTLFSYSISGTGASGTDLAVGPIPTVTGVTAGTYGITVVDQVSGCPTTSIATVNDQSFSVTTSQVGTCDPITLQVLVTQNAGFPIPTTPLSYRVINNSTLAVVEGPSANNNLSFITNTPLEDNESYVVEVRDNTGCLTSSNAFQINEGPEVPATFTTDLCVNPITITASRGNTFTWTGPNIVNSSQNQITVQATPPLGAQVYAVTITETGFCALDTTINVNVQAPISIALSKTDECADEVTVTATATPSGNYLYRWFRNGSFDPGLGGPQVLATTANNNQQYRVTIYNPVNGCTSDSPTETVLVKGELTVDLTATAPCEGQPFTLTATPSRTVSNFGWALNGTTINGETTGTLTVTDGRAGTYSVTATEDGCTATDETGIIISPSTPGNLNARLRICPDPANPDPNTREAVLNPGEFISYNWFRNGVALGVTDPIYTTGQAGEYTVELVNSFGCASTDKAQVVIDCDPVIVGPNAFRPSSSLTENQGFKLFTFFIDDEDFQILIFNRWGEMIFESDERTFLWNGSYANKGELLPPGTYTYVVRYKSSFRPQEGIKEKRGGVVLIR